MSIKDPSYPARASFDSYHVQDNLIYILSYPRTEMHIISDKNHHRSNNENGGGDSWAGAGMCAFHEVYIMVCTTF